MVTDLEAVSGKAKPFVYDNDERRHETGGGSCEGPRLL
jgi:hypothetical protein